MDVQELRKERFEKWVEDKQSGYNIDLFWREGYVAWETEFAFHAYCEALDSVCIQMPQQSEVNLDWNQATRYCIKAVEAEGLRWKP